MATVFDKLNQVYKDYLEAEQSYTQVRHPRSFLLPKVTRSDFYQGFVFFSRLQAMESGPSRGSAAQKRPVRTQAVIDQSDMYTHVLSSFTERKVRRTGSCEFPPKRFQTR